MGSKFFFRFIKPKPKVPKTESQKKLRDIFNSSDINGNKIVMSCGSSVSAASLALAYSLINDDYIPKIYIGSWSEFGKK